MIWRDGLISHSCLTSGKIGCISQIWRRQQDTIRLGCADDKLVVQHPKNYVKYQTKQYWFEVHWHSLGNWILKWPLLDMQVSQGLISDKECACGCSYELLIHHCCLWQQYGHTVEWRGLGIPARRVRRSYLLSSVCFLRQPVCYHLLELWYWICRYLQTAVWVLSTQHSFTFFSSCTSQTPKPQAKKSIS